MSQSKIFNFLQKSGKPVKTRQNRLLLLLVMGLVMVIVFLKIQCNLEHLSIISVETQNGFDWLRKINNLSLFVRPGQETALLMPKNISHEKERQFIVCFVMSSPKNTLARNAIRQTWGKITKPLFLMGRTDNKTATSVTQEAHRFNDIIFEDFIDSYANLTIKTAFAMKTFVKYFNDTKYFLKIDDDVFLYPKNLFKILDGSNNVIYGKRETLSRPTRDNKHRWFVPEYLFDESKFPPYVCGGAYVLPGEMK